MAFLHQGLFAELSTFNTETATLLENRIYPGVIPQRRGVEPQYPALTYREVFTERQSTYCETSRLVTSRYRLDCYAVDMDSARELAAAVRVALRDYSGLLGGIVDVRHAFPENDGDVPELDPGAFRVSQSWIFWHVED